MPDPPLLVALRVMVGIDVLHVTAVIGVKVIFCAVMETVGFPLKVTVCVLAPVPKLAMASALDAGLAISV